MPPDVYQEALRKVKAKLSELFETVASTIEGPQKQSYGDLDLLVVPRQCSSLPSGQDIAQRLDAVKWVSSQQNVLLIFAIPWPKDNKETQLPHDENRNSSHETSSSETGPADDRRPSTLRDSSDAARKCIQLDLTICSTIQEMQWKIFESAHGDFGCIISAMLRSKGFTLNNQALYLRIASVEDHNRRAARVELSRDPEQVMRYLGLDSTQFWQPFSTLDEMMTFIATCRFFKPAKTQSDDEAKEDRTDAQVEPDTPKKPNPKSRPVLDYWFDTFLPAHSTDEPGKDAHLTREQVLEDAYTFFGPEIKTAYETQKAKAEKDIVRQTLWEIISTEIRTFDPEISDEDLGDTMKALKRIIQRGIPTTIDTATAPADEEGQRQSYKTVHEAYKAEAFAAVIAWCTRQHATVLLAHRRGDLDRPVSARLPLPMPGDDPTATDKPWTYSTHGLETYTHADDEIIMAMKRVENASWTQILAALGKKSRSQLQDHWKRDLEWKSVPPPPDAEK